MTENKRYSLDFEECDAIWIDDNVENKSYTIRNDTIKEKELEEIVDLLNEQDQRITELENLLNTLDEKSKELQVTTELINEIKDELITLHGKEIPINYNNKYRDENFKFNYYALIKKLNEALIKYDKIEELKKENAILKGENEELISMNNNLAKAIFKDIELTEEDFQQAWEEYKEEIKNKPFSELFKEMIGGKKND